MLLDGTSAVHGYEVYNGLEDCSWCLVITMQMLQASTSAPWARAGLVHGVRTHVKANGGDGTDALSGP